MKRLALLFVLALLGFVFAGHAVGRVSAVGASGEIEANPTQQNTYRLKIVNSGDQPLECIQFFLPSNVIAAGVQLTAVSPPSNAHVGHGPQSFGGGFTPPLAPGQTAFFVFQTNQAYPNNGGGILHVSADCQTDVVVTVPGPGSTPPPTTSTTTTIPVTPKKCKCAKLTVKLDGTLLNKKGLRPDKHDFGVGFTWTMKCSKGNGGCTGSLLFSPPKILAGSIPTPPNNLRLNLKVMKFVCPANCGQQKSGRFQVKMLSRDQLNKLFGRTLAYTIRSKCGGVTKVQKVNVFVDQKGVLRAHP